MQSASLLFLDDGVFVLKREQDTAGVGRKDFVKGFRPLPDYDGQHLYIEERSLAERGLTPADLIMGVETVTPERAGSLIDTHDVVLAL